MEKNDWVIPTYHIYIEPSKYMEMKRDVWSEEPTHANFIYEKLKYSIGIVYRGYHIRKARKKSYNIQFVQPRSWQGAREIHLNAEYNDPSLMRSKLSFEFFDAIGVLSPQASYVQLILNGKFEGVYLQLESVDENYLKRRNLPLGAIFYATNDDANFSLITPEETYKKKLDAGYKQKTGTKSDHEFLCELIYKINTVPKAEFSNSIIHYMDINKYLLWLAGVMCTQNYDGFNQNYALYRNGETGLFEMIPWDYDATWGRDIHGEEMEHDYVPIKGYNTLTARILDVPYFRHIYKQILEEVIDTRFNVDFLEPRIVNLNRSIRPYVENDPYIKKKLRIYDREIDYILDYVMKRNQYLKEHLMDLK
ncbi:MAG TPA: CotH kinase family protein [Bacillota bacterium]|nr:CotH kinase family protein [Bacillota bacterium]